MAALKRSLLLLALCLYTSFAAGPFVWAAMLSLRTTSEIHLNHFAFPNPAHWDKFPEAWFGSNYGVYFANSLQVVVVAVLILTFVGAMAAHCLGRYRFRLNRAIYFILFSTIIFPPQITIISLFQILVNYGLFNSKLGPLGIMQFPAAPGAACTECRTIAIGGSYVANAETKHPKEVIAFFNSFLAPEVGNRWLDHVKVQTGIKSDPSKMTDAQAADYFRMIEATNAGAKYYFGIPIQVLTGKPKEVFTQVINNAFPAGNISVEDSVKELKAAY